MLAPLHDFPYLRKQTNKNITIMSCKYHKAIFHAVLAAALYALSMPFSKLLLEEVPPTMLAAFLYLGAGAGMIILSALRRQRHEQPLRREDLRYTVAMVALDIAAPILLMLGLKFTPAANASLLNNFEIVATAIIAFTMFHEAIGRRLWIAIALITLSSILLTVESEDSFSFSFGSLLVLAATVCWGLENNCTRQIADRDPLQIVMVKGLGSGTGALAVALKHLLLHLRPARHRSRPHQCLLRHSPVYRRRVVYVGLARASRLDFLHRPCLDAHWGTFGF